MKIISKLHKRVSRNKWNRKIRSLVQNGAEIGEHIAWFSDNIVVDATRPYLLHIGDYCKITRGVIILTHDYSLSVMRRVYGEWIGEGKETYIGDNCFIGMNSIILMGAHIGNNCIVGAGSVVHGTFPDNVVIAGNPASVICSLTDHYEDRCEKTVDEAKQCARLFQKRLGKEPTPKDLMAFRFLFAPRNDAILKEYGMQSFECNGDNADEIRQAFFNSHPYYDDWDAFMDEVRNEK